jgi:hypothetical protein
VVNTEQSTPAKGAKAVSTQPDNDWWQWAMIAAIFALSTAAVWLPVIVEARGHLIL